MLLWHCGQALTRYCPSLDDPLPLFLARAYATNHPAMRLNTNDTTKFFEGTVQGAQWYTLLGGMQVGHTTARLWCVHTPTAFAWRSAPRTNAAGTQVQAWAVQGCCVGWHIASCSAPGAGAVTARLAHSLTCVSHPVCCHHPCACCVLHSAPGLGVLGPAQPGADAGTQPCHEAPSRGGGGTHVGLQPAGTDAAHGAGEGGLTPMGCVACLMKWQLETHATAARQPHYTASMMPVTGNSSAWCLAQLHRWYQVTYW